MTFKIQKPTMCRAVIFTASLGTPKHNPYGISVNEGKPFPARPDEYPGIIIHAFPGTSGCFVDLVTFGMKDGDDGRFMGGSFMFHRGVPHSAEPKAGTWRYPPITKEEIEVDE